MRPARLFLSQSILDRWLSDGTADVTGDTLTIQPDDRKFDLATAVLFEKEVTESGDPHGLIGKVKDLEQIAELGGDYSVGTVIVGDEAYEVTDGFAGTPLQGDTLRSVASLAPPSSGPKTDPEGLRGDATAVGTTSPGATSPGTTSPGAASLGEGSPAASSPGATSAAGDLAAAIGSAAGSSAGAVKSESELDLLARFFLEKH